MSTNYSVLYFTGTGNSRYVANKIAAALGCSAVDIGVNIKNCCFDAITTEKNCVVVVPLYFWRIPSVIEEYLLKAGLSGASNIWYVMTYGGEFANCDKYNRKLSEKLNCNHMGTRGVIMPCNHVTMMDVPDEKKKAEKLKDAESVISSIIADLKGGISFSSTSPSFIDIAKSEICPVVCKVMITEKPFWVSDKCIGCGKCVDLCQFNNISLVNGKPQWSANCTHCLACINMCPVQAIEYGHDTEKRGRYRLK